MSNRAVKDGQLLYVSATQISTHQLCPRKYYYTYVLGMRPPKTPGQDKGTSGHKQMERYVLAGETPTDPSAALFVKEKADWLPCPDIANIEHPKDKDLGIEIDGTKLVGQLDYVSNKGGALWCIIDWKFVKDLKYAKKDLVTDVQMATYAYYVNRVSSLLGTYLAHVYFRTDPEKPPKYRIIEAPLLTPEDVVKNYEAFVVPPVYEIKDTCRLESVEDALVNTDNCFKFGPCPFRFGCSAFKERWGNPRGSDPFHGGLVSSFLDYGPDVTGEDVMSLDTLFKMEQSVPAEQRISPPDRADNVPIKSGGLNLFIDCSIERRGRSDFFEHATFLDDLIYERSKPICESNNVKDVREVKYGEGKVALLRSFREYPPTGNIIARTGGLSTDVLEVLLPMADLVVRG